MRQFCPRRYRTFLPTYVLNCRSNARFYNFFYHGYNLHQTKVLVTKPSKDTGHSQFYFIVIFFNRSVFVFGLYRDDLPSAGVKSGNRSEYLWLHLPKHEQNTCFPNKLYNSTKEREANQAPVDVVLHGDCQELLREKCPCYALNLEQIRCLVVGRGGRG